MKTITKLRLVEFLNLFVMTAYQLLIFAWFMGFTDILINEREVYVEPNRLDALGWCLAAAFGMIGVDVPFFSVRLSLMEKISKERKLKEEEKKILTPGERWEEGIEHHPKSKELFEFIEDVDLKYNNDYFCWKSGGDGDNGEQLMYLMDMYFESKDE